MSTIAFKKTAKATLTLELGDEPTQILEFAGEKLSITVVNEFKEKEPDNGFWTEEATGYVIVTIRGKLKAKSQ